MFRRLLYKCVEFWKRLQRHGKFSSWDKLAHDFDILSDLRDTYTFGLCPSDARSY